MRDAYSRFQIVFKSRLSELDMQAKFVSLVSLAANFSGAIALCCFRLSLTVLYHLDLIYPEE